MASYDNPRPSSQPIGSTDPSVVKDDLITLDYIVESGESSVTTRTGKSRKTLKGLEELFDSGSSAQLESQQEIFNEQLTNQQSTFEAQLSDQQTAFDNQLSSAIATAGYTIVGSFEDGTTVSTRSEAVYYAGDPLDNYANEAFYIWTGAFPKTVTAGDTPFDESGWMLAATGYTKQSGAGLLLGQVFAADVSIPVGQNMFSINPTVNEGVTITVPEGSEWVILGDIN